MRILLDTHIWLWMNQAPEKLSVQVRDLIQDNENDLYLSVAAIWEIAIKHRLGKLTLPLEPSLYVPGRMHDNGVKALDIAMNHVLASATLPNHHQDPFDRLMIAQAILENLTFITVDEKIRAYDVSQII
jgi:PIN domain nuclease of toxin-antitoxin system